MRNTFTPSTFFARLSLSAFLLVFLMAGLHAQVQLSNGSSTSTLEFDNLMPITVGSNPSTAFSGAGFDVNTAVAGRLNSNAWAVTGWSNGALAFGGTQITANTDYTRGATAIAVVTGGIYAFTGAPQTVANPCLMIQPGGSDWAPGTMTLKIENTGTTNITELKVDYNLYIRNDQGRSNSFNFSHSADNVTYTAVAALDYTSIATADVLGWVLVGGVAPSRSTTITGLNIAPGAFYYIRWSGADVGGSGSRDEFGLDDIAIAATFDCDITSVTFENISDCNDNDTSDPSDDFFTADVVIDFVSPPNSGDLQIEPGGDAIGTYSIAVGSLVGNSHTFTNVQFKADGTPTIAEVEFTIPANQCVQTEVGPTVASCSPVCDITSVNFINVDDCNDNDTADPTDDFFTADVVVNFINPPNTGFLQIEPGGDAIGIYSIAVGSLIGNMHTFTNVQFKADGTPTIAEVEFTIPANQCVQTEVGPTVTSCSTNPCDPDVTDPVFDQNPLPQDLTISCSDPLPPFATLTASDFCDEIVPVIPSSSIILGDCPQESVVTRTWSATDMAGNTVTHMQVITIVDNAPPMLIGLPNQMLTLECDQPLPPVPTVTASDACDTDVPVSFSTSTEPGSCPQKYTLYRTWTAEDDCGNGASFTQTINIVDNTAPVFNQNPLPQNITVSCSNIPMPVTLDGTDNCDPGIPIPVIFINEIHYDNTGADAAESIEIAGTAGIDLSNYQLVLYNGSDGAPYNAQVLNGLIDNEAGGFGAVSFAIAGIQNGAPDGIVLATTTGIVLQFLSYEGAFTAVGGVANGLLSTDIGVLENGANALGTSLQLTGVGQEYSNFTWVGPIAASAGTLNAGQVINPLPGVIPAEFSQMMEAGDCNGESTITRMWELSDACGNSIIHTQIITVEDTEGPSFSPPPLPADLTLSCELPVPVAPTLTAADLCDVPGMLTERVWINEVHYDNAGGDMGEFIEIAGTAGTDLSTYNLVLYNGANGMSYNTTVLGGVIPNQANGFGTLCFGYPVDGIQNGAPDAIALVHNVMGGMVVQFLSYEGAFVATNGPANGMMSTNIGIDEDPAPAIGNSIYLTGNGDEYADFTWVGPLASSNCGVNAGQTFIAASQGPTVIFTESQMAGICPQERKIIRKWTATDNCGNETVLNQTISIVDDTPPTVNCPANLTLNLDIFGNASLPLGNINFTYSDNCAPNSALVVLPFTTQQFTCADEGLTRPVTISVQDPCGNVGSCTINVTIAPFSRCTPTIRITDPCVCKNNATTLSNGQFGETIKIESLAGKTWTIIANTGLYSAGSPAPPSAPILIPIGTTFTENPVPSGDYFLTGVHVDALGYSITVRSETGQILMIGNSCQYPNPAITSDLSGPFCLFSDPVALTGTPGDANIVSQGFTVNGVPATQFDPSQGVGQYNIVYSVNGGVPKAFGPNDPGCIQKISLFVNVVATPSSLNCNDLVTVSLDDDDCAQEIFPDMVLEGSYGCYDDYLVEIDQTVPYGNGPWDIAIVEANDINKTYQYRVTHLVSGNKCWGNIKIEDKLAPALVCENFSVPCNTLDLSPNYLFNTLNRLEAFPVASDCQSFTTSYIDTEVPKDCASGLTKVISRIWTAVDGSGNISTCLQTIGLIRPTINDVTLPPNYDGFGAPAFNCTAIYPSPDWIESQGLQGYPYAFGNIGGCNINASYIDVPILVCDGTYKIKRRWTLLNWCASGILHHDQWISVEDKQGPSMVCPANTTVSVDAFQCCGTIDLPDLVIEDECSRINNISGMVTLFDFETGDQTGMVVIGGSLQDFPGNNWWDRDTLAAFGTTPCLPIGNQVVTYIAKDDCGNSTTCSFRLSVRDLVPPVVSCDETTTVAIGVDDPFDCYGPAGPNGQPAALDACNFGGVTWVKASVFNDGTYDNCNNVKLTIRRMDPVSSCIAGLNSVRGTLPCDNPNQSLPSERDRAIGEQDSIKFYCCEVGTTQTIVLAAYQLNPNGSVATGVDGTPLKNECMIQVEVQDKIKPTCNAPAPVTVNCENFDPSLWSYGKATVSDNCCLDTSIVYQGQCGLSHSVNYALFDTVCNKGTITRTFRAYDCQGQSSSCTQRVVVTYFQEYYLRLPNDAIVTVCDDSARYDEPKFFGEDCELLGVSFEDEIFTVVPDACFKIERTWTIINWCTYNPNQDCIYIPNPNPNANNNHITNLPGPTVSPCGTLPPWKSTVVKILPTDPLPGTDYCSFWEKEANCYKYKQIIKIIDGQAPVFDHCPSDTVYCDVTANNAQLWNTMDWWDNTAQSHDLCEGPADLCITARDGCSGPNISAHYLLFLDLDNDGDMETVINSLNPPPPGIVFFGNANNPNFGGGTPRQFDNRGLPNNQTYQFSTLQRFNPTGTKRIFHVRWNTLQFPNVYTIPEFPHGTHKIKWIIQDGCGNQSVCEHNFTIKDCKAPTVVCLNGLSVNIMPTGMIPLWASDFLQYAEDNCTPSGQLKIGIRKCGDGTGFPLNPDGTPQTSVNFTCAELGTQCVEIWAIDAAGNADYCETYVIVQDNLGNCPNGHINVAGEVKTEMTEGIEEAMVHINGTSTFTPPYSFFDLSDANGVYQVMNNVPLDASFTIAPEKEDNPLNGVTTYDLVLISKHILATEVFDSPYKIIAADANKSNSITTFDIVELRKLILGIYTELPNNSSWRFVDHSFSFPNANNPFETVFPESISVADAIAHHMHEDFMGVKVGDVNYSAVANATMQAEARSSNIALFDVTDRELRAGETFEVTFKAAQALQGFQFTMTLKGLELMEVIETEQVNSSNFGKFGQAITVSIDQAQAFTLRFRATQAGKLSELLGVSGAITRAEAYLPTAEPWRAGTLKGGVENVGIALRFDGKTISGLGFELYQNQPNPFVNKTSIGFHLPESGEATLSVYDETGRAVYQQKGQFSKGENFILLDKSLLNTSGLLYYKLETATNSATKKMIQAK